MEPARRCANHRGKGSATGGDERFVTRHGPLIGGDGAELLACAGQRRARIYPIPHHRHQSRPELAAVHRRDSRASTGPGSNFVYADVDGNIGYHAAGEAAEGAAGSGRFAAGRISSGEFRLGRLIRLMDLPSAYNPAGGIIATANQNPFPADYPYPVNGSFAPPAPRNPLRACSRHAADGAPPICSACRWIFLGIPPVPGRGGRWRRTRSAARRIRMLDPSSRCCAVGTAVKAKNQGAPFLSHSCSPPRAQGRLRRRPRREKDSVLIPRWVRRSSRRRLLRERPDGWFADYDAMLLRSLVDAVDEGKRIQGGNLPVEVWRVASR